MTKHTIYFLLFFLFLLPQVFCQSDIKPDHKKELTKAIAFKDIPKLIRQHHPMIEAARHNIIAHRGTALQSKLSPNPKFFSEFEHFGGTGNSAGTGQLESRFGLSQEFLLGNKQRKQYKVASHDTDIAQIEMEIILLKLEKNAKQQFFNVLMFQKLAIIENRNLELANELHAVIIKRIKAGDTSPMQEKKSSVLANIAKAKLLRTNRELGASKLKLFALCGLKSIESLQLSFNYEKFYELSSISEFKEKLLSSPIIQAKNKIKLKGQAELVLARAQNTPNLELEGGIKKIRETNDHSYFIGVNFPLKIFDRNQGNIIEKKANLKKYESELQTTILEQNSNLISVFSEIQALENEMKTAKEFIIPNAQLVFEKTRRAYEIGELSLLELIDAQKILLEAKRSNILLENEYFQKTLELEALTATPIIKEKEVSL